MSSGLQIKSIPLDQVTQITTDPANNFCCCRSCVPEITEMYIDSVMEQGFTRKGRPIHAISLFGHDNLDQLRQMITTQKEVLMGSARPMMVMPMGMGFQQGMGIQMGPMMGPIQVAPIAPGFAGQYPGQQFVGANPMMAQYPGQPYGGPPPNGPVGYPVGYAKPGGIGMPQQSMPPPYGVPPS
jgi:hypothetical protein